ncbi:hypothetical protein [Halobacillus litoralis]|uniref:hypothetical protein n=1 Tax=Halobacillus litoralis TaxID=45668 RepID=UPI001CFDCC6C|nr:hypothetical protein [Halobacillus litoralis]
MKKLSLFTLLFVLLLSACGEADVDKADELEESAATEEQPKEDESTEEAVTSEEASEEAETTEDTTTEDASTEDEEMEDQKEEKETATEEPAEEAADDEEESVTSASTEEQEESTSSAVGLKAYMPEGPMTKTFIQNGELEATHEIIDVNDRYVQQVITFGDMVTLQILEWKEGTISLVYQESNPEDTSSQLDSFESYETIDVLVDVTKQGSDWQILDEKQSTQTPYQQFEDVFVVQRASGENVKSISFYAPDYGLIKEKVEDKGENGYTMNSELTNIEK